MPIAVLIPPFASLMVLVAANTSPKIHKSAPEFVIMALTG